MAPRGCRFRPGWPGRHVHTVLGVLRLRWREPGDGVEAVHVSPHSIANLIN